LGQAQSPHHERGIDGYTDRHIHFHTPTTTVMMGKDCQLLPGHVGYSMVTKDNAYHHADLQSCFISETSEMVLRTAGARGAVARAVAAVADVVGGASLGVAAANVLASGNGNAVLQSDTGTAEIAAGRCVDITAENTVYITAGGGYSAYTGTYDTAWQNASRDGGLTTHVSHWATLLYCAQVAGVTIAGFESSRRQCKDGSSSIGVELMQAVPKGAAAVLNIMACAAALGDSPDAIKVSADRGIGIASQKTVMFGHILSCLTTLGGATLAAATAEIKGWAMATVWAGHTATLCSSNISKVSSPFGTVLFDATRTASFTTDKELLVGAKGNVSLRTDGNTVALYGGEKAYVGSAPPPGGHGPAAPTPGYGLFVDTKSVAIGKMNAATDFTDPKLDLKYALVVKQGTVHARYGDDAMLHVSDRKTVILKRDNKHFVKVSSKGVLVKGEEIHLD
jgi:hypothetical protein